MEYEEIKAVFDDRPLNIYQILFKLGLSPKDRLNLYHALRFYEASGQIKVIKSNGGKCFYFPVLKGDEE